MESKTTQSIDNIEWKVKQHWIERQHITSIDNIEFKVKTLNL